MNKKFVYLDEMVPNIRWDAKYATWDNFTGKPVDGYEVNRIVGTKALGEALIKVQKKAAENNYGLLLWDGYRPQRAVNCFLNWVSLCENNYTKAKHYPNIDKKDMIIKGYIAEKSGHSRGSTIDLTIFSLDTGELLPMGGNFDFMDTISNHSTTNIKKTEYQNRQYLRAIMELCGFSAYENEWWHYSLVNEPFPNTYFDFPISTII